MSDSPRHGRKSSGAVIKPQVPSEKSFIENMAGLIHEVVPQAYAHSPTIEAKEEILWCKFETIDYNNQPLGAEPETNGNSPPIILILGYSKGYQVWAILANGDAQEIVSFRQGKVRCMKILPRPERTGDRADAYSHKRPIIAICDSHGIESNLSTAAFASVTFQSLRTGEALKTIKFKNSVIDIQANERVIVVTFPEKAAIFDSCTFEDRFTLTSCYLCPGLNLNPIALGPRWLAYAEKKLSLIHKSGGGFEGEGVQSYTATVIHAAKSITKGLREMGGSLASSLIGQKSSSPPHPSAITHPGIVTIVDLLKVGKGEVNLTAEDVDGIVAHFIAHSNEPVSHLQFDPSGCLLFTADKQGRNFHIFKIMPHPCSSVQSSVHHLYTLYRGDTSARVHDVSFSVDSRWVTVSTHRGTVHVFPMTPYGGPVTVRTQTSQKVVNRMSRFHRSAGLDEKVQPGSSPVLSQSPSHSKLQEMQLLAVGNPRLPPYPLATVVTPLAQIRQPLSLSSSSRMSPGAGSKSRHSSEDDLGLRVNVCFSTPRSVPPQFSTLPGTGVMREKSKGVVDSLFVLSSLGYLVEYCLEPKVSITVPREKINDESPIDLDFHPISQWNLLRSSANPDLPLPLSSTCLLILSPVKTPGDPGNMLVSSWNRADVDMEPALPESWLSQVEITTYAGPHRRLWMGPQFTFKTIHPGTGSESEPMEIELTTPPSSNPRSNPVNMPRVTAFNFGDINSSLPMVIEAGGSASSFEQSPRMSGMRYMGKRGSTSSVAESAPGNGDIESQLQESIADAMLDCGTLPPATQGGAVVHFYAGSEDSSVDSPAATSLGSYVARPCEFRPIKEGLPERKRGVPVIRKDFGDIFDDCNLGSSPEVAELFSASLAKPVVSTDRCAVRRGLEAAMLDVLAAKPDPEVARVSKNVDIEVPRANTNAPPKSSGESSSGVLSISLSPPPSVRSKRKNSTPSIFPVEFDNQELKRLSEAPVADKQIVRVHPGDVNAAIKTLESLPGGLILRRSETPPVSPAIAICDEPEDVDVNNEMSDYPRGDSSDGSSSVGPVDDMPTDASEVPRAETAGSVEFDVQFDRVEHLSSDNRGEESDSDEFEIRPDYVETDLAIGSEKSQPELPELVSDFFAKELSSLQFEIEEAASSDAFVPISETSEYDRSHLVWRPCDSKENEAWEVDCDVPYSAPDLSGIGAGPPTPVADPGATPLPELESPLGILNENYGANETGDVETNLVKTEPKSDESDKAALEEEEAETNNGVKSVSRKQKRKGKKKK